jgi:type-F conjugative transfer system pilin assembly protein TrbC
MEATSMLRILILTGFVLLGQFAMADQQSLLEASSMAMEQAAKFQPEAIDYSQAKSSKDLVQSRQAVDSMEQSRPVIPSMPKLDLLAIPTPKVDIANLARQGQNLIDRSDQQAPRYESQILVFVSSSMPDKTVQNYLRQTTDIDAALVFRGLKHNSMKDMQLYLSTIVGDQIADKTPTILIDPTLFERFEIEQVPVTLVTESRIQPCQKMPCPTPVYHTVSGDVSLPWALSLVSRQADSEDLKATLRPLVKDMGNQK